MTNRKSVLKPSSDIRVDASKIQHLANMAHGEEAHELLQIWTRVHEVLGKLCRPRPADRADYDNAAGVWAPAVRRTLQLLPQYLEAGPTVVADASKRLQPRKGGSPSARTWLVLRLSLHVLGAIGDAPRLLDYGIGLLCADLSHVLHETVRHACSESQDDVLDPSTYVAALCRVVEYHAHDIVRLPREYNVMRILGEIGEQSDLNPAIGIEPLRHVLDVYIAGHFLPAVNVRVHHAAGEAQPAGGICGPTGVDEMTFNASAEIGGHSKIIAQAYSLASIFHGVGDMLAPLDTIPLENDDWDDPEIIASLRKVADSVKDTESEVTQRCFDDLGTVYCTEDELCRWRNSIHAADLTRELLGAWYLHRVGQDVLRRSADIKGVREEQTEILRIAVRSVLLRRVATGQGRGDLDPVATTLLACNELFQRAPEQGKLVRPVDASSDEPNGRIP